MIKFPPEIMEATLVSRLLQWRDGIPAPPYRAHVQLTRRCNLNCRMCWQPQQRTAPQAELNDDELLRFIDQAAAVGVEEWNLIGGEPLLRPETVLAMIRSIRLHRMNGDLSTNGTLFRDELLATVVETGWRRVRFSIDSPHEIDHDYLRGKDGALRRALAAIERLAAQRHNDEQPAIEIMMVMSRRNFHQLAAMVELCHGLGVNRLTVQPMSVWAAEERAERVAAADEASLDEAVQAAAALADEARLQHNLRELLEPSLVFETDRMDRLLLDDPTPDADFLCHPCFDPWFVLALRPDGSLGPCDRFENTATGDRAEAAVFSARLDLAAIWHGSFFNKVRQALSERRLPGFCTDCCVCKFSHIRFLRIQALLASGEFVQPEHLLRKLLAKNPRRDLWWLLLGNALYGQSRYSEAISAYETAQAINPNLAWHPKGECLKHSGRFETALHCLEKSLEFAPQRAAAWYSIGEIRQSLGYPDAADAFKQAQRYGLEPPPISQTYLAVSRV